MWHQRPSPSGNFHRIGEVEPAVKIRHCRQILLPTSHVGITRQLSHHRRATGSAGDGWFTLNMFDIWLPISSPAGIDYQLSVNYSCWVGCRLGKVVGMGLYKGVLDYKCTQLGINPLKHTCIGICHLLQPRLKRNSFPSILCPHIWGKLVWFCPSKNNLLY